MKIELGLNWFTTFNNCFYTPDSKGQVSSVNMALRFGANLMSLNPASANAHVQIECA